MGALVLGRLRSLWAVASLLVMSLAWPGALLAQTATVYPGAVYEGVASCSGSTCHGRAEGNGAVVRQDELAHWQDPSSPGGAHSRSYDALASARGMRIAAALGLGAATSAPACLGCHATTGPAAHGARYQIADGVGCESCHGAASGWLASHYSVRGTHADNVAHGMVALDQPQVRAGVCLSCHFGSSEPGHFVTHRMMAAGHPRLSFELDLFSALQQHWNEDADYVQRKHRADHVQLWAVGQAEAVRRSVTLFATPGYAAQGLFPEFYFFDCHSCHRQIDDNPARVRGFETNAARPIPFGTPPYNDENMILLSAVAQVFAPAAAAEFDGAVREFHAGLGTGHPAPAAARLAAAAARLENALGAMPPRPDAAFQVIAAISGKAITPRFTDYEGSVQAVMALDTLLNALVHEGRITVGAAAGIRTSINRAYDAVRAPNSYNPPAFRAALADAAHAVEVLK
jgi:hypothetical protein